MASSVTQRAHQACKAPCSECWRNLGIKRILERDWSSATRLSVHDMYYLWRLEQPSDDDAMLLGLLRALLSSRGSNLVLGGLFDSDSADEEAGAGRTGLLCRVIAEARPSPKLLGHSLVRAWKSNRYNRPGLQLLVDAGARVSKREAFRLRGVGGGCVRGLTHEGIMGKYGATDEDIHSDQEAHLCRMVDVRDGRWHITNCFTGVVYCFLDEVVARMFEVEPSFFVAGYREEEDAESEVTTLAEEEESGTEGAAPA